jgi:hypothetical protein
MFCHFGVHYDKIGTIQRRLAWPLHKDDTLDNRNGSSDLPIYFCHSFSVLAIFLRAVDRFVDRIRGGRLSALR